MCCCMFLGSVCSYLGQQTEQQDQAAWRVSPCVCACVCAMLHLILAAVVYVDMGENSLLFG